jgi:2-methylcitrate dehydratase PrpD
MEITKRLADFIANTAYEDVPAKAIELAKLSFLDTMGIALGGSVEDGTRILSRFVRESGGRPMASLVGQGFKSAAQSAALVNGTASDIIGFSDLSVASMHHPSAGICPAIWALGEQYQSSGKDAILAHVIGLEIADKIAMGVKPRFHQRGWHPLGVLNTFGATAASGKLLGLDTNTMAKALGIAGQEASGIRGAMGSMSKAYGAGLAAENGVVAARLAQMGFTGTPTIMEVKYGFLETFGEGADGLAILEHLGDPFTLIEPGITLKPYPSCTCTHTAITGVLNLREKHNIAPEDVESVVCSVSPRVADVLKFPDPKSKFESKYSMSYCVAKALLEGKIAIASFSDEQVKDPRIQYLIKRVTMIVSPELAKLGYNPENATYGATVTIRLKSGEEYVHRLDKGPWEPETPPTWDKVSEKFRSCASLVLKPKEIEESIEIIHSLEKAANLCRLMDIVRC